MRYVLLSVLKRNPRKVVGFEAHIQITAFDNNAFYEYDPISFSDTLAHQLLSYPEIRHIQGFITKAGIIKTDDDFQGIVLKGIGDDYDCNFFKKNLVEGEIFIPNDTSTVNPAIISKTIADKLRLKLGDSFTTYFVQDPVRARRFKITGIYQTNFEDYDKLYVITKKMFSPN